MRFIRFTPHARGSTLFPACLLAPIQFTPHAGSTCYDAHTIISYLFTRMRGSTALQTLISIGHSVYPACEDRPFLPFTNSFFWFTPHARGSTSTTFTDSILIRVYPACAGIDPAYAVPGTGDSRLPRMRGDRPALWLWYSVSVAFTPHARGSTSSDVEAVYRFVVYPACAGIDLS